MSTVHFLADSMLGKLARWMRLIGYYVEYAGSEESDTQIIEHCIENNLFLLTRDREMSSRYANSLYLDSDKYFVQLKRVMVEFPPDKDLYFSRCPVCNGLVNKIPANSYSYSLPESVRERFYWIYLCNDCGKVYWEGSHFEAILETIKRLENAI